MNIKQGSVVLLNFPFSSRVNTKVRPALVISNDAFNKGEDVIVLAISSQGGKHAIVLDQKDLIKGELKKKSYIKCGAILSIEKSLIIKSVAIICGKKLQETITRFQEGIVIC